MFLVSPLVLLVARLPEEYSPSLYHGCMEGTNDEACGQFLRAFMGQDDVEFAAELVRLNFPKEMRSEDSGLIRDVLGELDKIANDWALWGTEDSGEETVEPPMAPKLVNHPVVKAMVELDVLEFWHAYAALFNGGRVNVKDAKGEIKELQSEELLKFLSEAAEAALWRESAEQIKADLKKLEPCQV